MFKPMSDEIALGHGHRIAIFNGLGKFDKLIKNLRTNQLQQGKKVQDLSTLDILAKAARIPTQDYALNHSMLPVMRVAAKYGNEFVHGSPEAMSINRRLGMLIPRKFACVCLSCIQEDFDQHGFSYFRRSHHLNGVDWCPNHGEVLNRVNSDNPFSKLPHFWRQQKMITPLPSFCLHINETPEFVQKYSANAIALLKQAKPLTVAIVNGRINLRVKALCFPVGEYGRKILLSDHVIKMAPTDWFNNSVYASSNQKKHINQNFFCIDGIVKSMGYVASYESYSLVLAATYNSTEIALGAFTAPPIDPSKEKAKYPSPKRLGQSFWNGHTLYSAYIECHGIYSDVADRFNLDRKNTREKMISMGFPSLKHYESSALLHAFRDFSQGTTILEACSQHGVMVADLEEFLRISSCRISNAIDHIEQLKRAHT
ncbi:TniQ family protein [Gallionella capsiferriformans]|uniref:TniQ domain-containing protein n=1 Tax=Gallionella capsiferriformans (strain ES-2) TaxID=395494 RepID=D9SFF7_GALCS|nr:TniQ family protein [Gallionella capsiferriformans]ADL55254.1 hypothetical protein Galf_1226 [Gallionella capsiferriformans ES-2]